MLPAAAALRKQGANKGATAAFLVATPESGIDSISVTWALLDPFMTVIRPVAALCTALVAGIGENLFFWDKEEREIEVDNSCPIDGCCDGIDCPEEEHRHHHTFIEKMVAGLGFAFGSVWAGIANWFFVGLIIAAIITISVPDSFMAEFLGGGVSSMLVMLVVGVPLYICATASTPVAAALVLKGVNPGAALVFLLVGPATNITSLSVLFGILGKRSTFLYLAAIAICAVAFGLIADFCYQLFHISPRAIVGSATGLLPFWVKLVSALVLCLISVKPLYSGITDLLRKKKTPENTFISDFPSLPSGKKGHSHGGDCGCHSHGHHK